MSAAVAWRPSHPPRRGALPPAAAANDDAEVAVFRFTLGSDTADAMVPRVVGGVGAALLALNHFLGESPSDAQVRLGMLLSPGPLLFSPLAAFRAFQALTMSSMVLWRPACNGASCDRTLTACRAPSLPALHRSSEPRCWVQRWLEPPS